MIEAPIPMARPSHKIQTPASRTKIRISLPEPPELSNDPPNESIPSIIHVPDIQADPIVDMPANQSFVEQVEHEKDIPETLTYVSSLIAPYNERINCEKESETTETFI